MAGSGRARIGDAQDGVAGGRGHGRGRGRGVELRETRREGAERGGRADRQGEGRRDGAADGAGRARRDRRDGDLGGDDARLARGVGDRRRERDDLADLVVGRRVDELVRRVADGRDGRAVGGQLDRLHAEVVGGDHDRVDRLAPADDGRPERIDDRARGRGVEGRGGDAQRGGRGRRGGSEIDQTGGGGASRASRSPTSSRRRARCPCRRWRG